MAAPLDQGRENIDDREKADKIGYRAPREPVRIARSIQKLVMMQHGVHDFGRNPGDIPQRLSSEHRMLFDHVHFVGIERARLLQDRGGNFGFADIVHDAGERKPHRVGA